MKKHVSLILLMLLLLTAMVAGQSITTAEFSGQVISSDEQPLPGVTGGDEPSGESDEIHVLVVANSKAGSSAKLASCSSAVLR